MDIRMPNEGSKSTIFTPYTGILPDEVSVALNAGYSFFKIMCVGVPTGTTVFGFYDITVRQRDSGDITRGPVYDPQWHKGVGFEKNNVRLHYDKKQGRSFAYIPDDPVWKNRIIFAGLIDTAKYIIAQYLTPEGLIDGAVITKQIRYMASVLYDHAVTGKDNKVLFRSKDLSESLTFEAKHKAEGGKCQTVVLPTERLGAIISKHKSNWMSSPEFRSGIRKEIEEEIDRQYKVVPTTTVTQAIENPKEILKNAFSMLTQQERLELFKGMVLEGKQETSTTAVPTQKEVEKRPIPPASNLEVLNMAQLREIAEEYDIFTKGMQREDIIKELKAISKKVAVPEKEVVIT